MVKHLQSEVTPLIKGKLIMAKEIKLHELLAVESQLKGQAQATKNELKSTFEKKRHLFEEKVVKFTPSIEEQGLKETREQQSDLQTTVHKELDWISDIWTKMLDTSLKVQEGCTRAFADVVLDNGTVLMTKIPVLALLELEKRASELQELVSSIPTLDPAKGFKLDADRGVGIFVAREVNKTRTRKEAKPLVKYPATKEHPAQTEVVAVDTPIGTITEQEWSGMITPAEKADMLIRVEELRRAVKQARMRANEVVTADTGAIGRRMLNYVFSGK